MPYGSWRMRAPLCPQHLTMVRLAEPLVRVMVRLRPPKSLGFTGVLTGLRPGPYVYHPPRLPQLNIMDLSSNLPKWLTPLNLPTLSGNLHQIAPAQIQDCNLVQIPPSEIAPISTELHQTAPNCTISAFKPFLHLCSSGRGRSRPVATIFASKPFLDRTRSSLLTQSLSCKTALHHRSEPNRA